MKINPLFATALIAASSTAACKSDRNGGELLASVRDASHPHAALLVQLPVPMQEQMLGPPMQTSKRVRALVAPTDLTEGPVDAPVVLAAYVDFGVADGDPVAALLEIQRAHKHDLRVALRPIIGPDPGSGDTAAAIFAAARQGKGWELAACASKAPPDPMIGVGACVATIDLDMTKYAADLEAIGPTLIASNEATRSLAIERSPTLFLNGYRIKGIPPIDVLERGVQASIDHAWKLAGSAKLARGQIYPELMRTASVPPPATESPEELN